MRNAPSPRSVRSSPRMWRKRPNPVAVAPGVTRSGGFSTKRSRRRPNASDRRRAAIAPTRRGRGAPPPAGGRPLDGLDVDGLRALVAGLGLVLDLRTLGER